MGNESGRGARAGRRTWVVILVCLLFLGVVGPSSGETLSVVIGVVAEVCLQLLPARGRRDDTALPRGLGKEEGPEGGQPQDPPDRP